MKNYDMIYSLISRVFLDDYWESNLHTVCGLMSLGCLDNKSFSSMDHLPFVEIIGRMSLPEHLKQGTKNRGLALIQWEDYECLA